MPTAAGGIYIDPNGSSAVVQVTTPTGVAIPMFSDVNCANSVVMPATITVRTAFYSQNPEPAASVSVKVGGTEYASPGNKVFQTSFQFGAMDGITLPDPSVLISAPTGTYVQGGALAINPTDPAYGAKGDGVTDDTTAFQAAATAAAGGYLFIGPGKNYLVGAITVPVTCKGIYGPGTITQKTAGANCLNVSATTGLTVDGVTFVGVAAAGAASSNSAIYATGATLTQNLRVRNCTFTSWQAQPILVQNAVDVKVTHNLIYSCSGTILFTGVIRGTIEGNVCRDPQTPAATVCLGITLDSTNGNTYPVCQDISIVGNVVKSYVNGQAIVMHAGLNITVSGNVLEDVLCGISLNPFQVGDTAQNVSIVGNTVRCTSTAGAANTSANYGIFVGGGSGFVADHVSVVGNTIYNAGVLGNVSFGQGGIGAGYANQLVIAGNVIFHCTNNGIVFGNPCTDLQVFGNLITDVVSGVAGQVGIYQSAGTQTGWIAHNNIDSAGVGIRFDGAASPGLIVGSNNIVTATNRIINASTATVIDTFLGSVLLGTPSLALAATDGYPYIPALAGAPTGIPTAQAGMVPVKYDTTNHKLWIYDAGWKGVVVV